MGFDAFLKIDGIKGESQDEKHKDEIHLVSYSFGATQPGSSAAGGGSGAGKVNMRDFSFSMTQDTSSSLLFQACCSGKHFPTGVLNVRKAGGGQKDYTTVTLSDFIVSGFHHIGNTGGSDQPVVEIDLNFSQIKYEYHSQDEKGNLGGAVTTTFNVKTMKAS
jgi:type VI secretion system secreted protein Hcp